MKPIFKIIMFLCSVSCFAQGPQQDFFANLTKLCGKTFYGKTIYPTKPESPFDQKLTMSVAQCDTTEIRIPFLVGADTSRTWVLTNTKQGLLFKHDHRHQDGSPHKITLYGGVAIEPGTATRQSFPADKATHLLVPEGKTNVWTLTLDLEKKTLSYFLERHSKPRYLAIFDLAEKNN